MARGDLVPARLYCLACAAKADGEQNLDTAPEPVWLTDLALVRAAWDALDDQGRQRWRRYAERLTR